MVMELEIPRLVLSISTHIVMKELKKAVYQTIRCKQPR